MDTTKQILIREIMTAEVVTVGSDDTIDQAIVKMRRAGCRRLPVVDGDVVVGIISDRDLRLASESPYLAKEPLEVFRHLKEVLVRDAMTRNPMTIEPDAPVVEAAQIMRLGRFGGLPVVDEASDELIGIVTRSDLLDVLIRLLQPAAGLDEGESKP